MYVGLQRPMFNYTIRPLGQAQPNIAKAINLREVRIHQNSKKKKNKTKHRKKQTNTKQNKELANQDGHGPFKP